MVSSSREGFAELCLKSYNVYNLINTCESCSSKMITITTSTKVGGGQLLLLIHGNNS